LLQWCAVKQSEREIASKNQKRIGGLSHSRWIKALTRFNAELIKGINSGRLRDLDAIDSMETLLEIARVRLSGAKKSALRSREMDDLL
jgi:hypothetical protein